MRVVPGLLATGLLTLYASGALAGLAADAPGRPRTASAAASAPDLQHRRWTAVLRANLRDGRVDYATLRRDRTALDAYLAELEAMDGAAFARLPPADRLAWWLNAYNAVVIRTVVEHYPISGRTLAGLAFPANSFWQIPGGFRRERVRLLGRDLSLDDIEHRIVRPEFRDPRIHAAVVCAALSCPPLRPEAYVGERLDAQLDEQSRLWIADARIGLRIDRERSRAYVSKIFDWFEEDFAPLADGNAERGVLEFVARHTSDPALAAELRSGRFRVDHLDYDWTLNER